MMQTPTTTPFGRRTVTLGHIAAQMQTGAAFDEARKPGSNHPAAVNKWALFRTLTLIRDQLGLSDRSLSLLNALLSFQQETALTLPVARKGREGEEAEPAASCDLVVFPSNRALSLRANGMAEKTLRRHLAALVGAGLILRRDSPNGKRYARKDASGQERFSNAFGFDLTPLVTRATEFEALAEALRREQAAVQLVKERISLHRRDIAKLIACGLDEGLEGPWEDLRQRFMALVTPLRRIRQCVELDAMAGALAQLRAEVNKILETHINSLNLTGNDGANDRHQSNSNTQCLPDFEPAFNEAGAKSGACAEPQRAPVTDPVPATMARSLPLGMVLQACPDVSDYAPGGAIGSWQQFVEAVRLLRPMLGISPDAWRGAIEVLGEADAAVVVASILQRSEHSSEARSIQGAMPGSPLVAVNGSPAIKSAGGYLRALTEKARGGEFSPGPLLMALIGQRLKGSRSGGRDTRGAHGASPGAIDPEGN